MDCGEANWKVLQFDHVKGIKDYEIAALINMGCALSKLQKEMDKCEIRCANCHHLKTAEQFGWAKYDMY